MPAVTPSPCTNCGKLLDRATAIGDEGVSAEPGDITVCINCGQVMVFAEDMVKRNFSPEEFERLPRYVRLKIQKARLAIAMINQRKKGKDEEVF